MTIPHLFDKFEISNYYRFILYVCGVAFLLSIFVPAQGLSNELVRSISLTIGVGAILLWMALHFLELYVERHWQLIENGHRGSPTFRGKEDLVNFTYQAIPTLHILVWVVVAIILWIG